MAQSSDNPTRVVKKLYLELDDDNDDAEMIGGTEPKDGSPGSPLFVKKASSSGGGRLAAVTRTGSGLSKSTDEEDSSDDDLEFMVHRHSHTETRLDVDLSALDAGHPKPRTANARGTGGQVSRRTSERRMSKRMSMLSIAESIPEEDTYGKRSSIISIMTNDDDNIGVQRKSSSRRMSRGGSQRGGGGGGGGGGYWPQQQGYGYQDPSQQPQHGYGMPMQPVQMMGFPMMPPMMQQPYMPPGMPGAMPNMQPGMPGMPPTMSTMPPAFPPPPQGLDWQQHAAATAAAQVAASAAYAAAYQQGTGGRGGAGAQGSAGMPGGPSMPGHAMGGPPMPQPFEATPAPLRTTVMLRNVPDTYTRDMLTSMLDREGFAGRYDFVYMPMNFRTKTSFGYAFVNMVAHEDAVRIHQEFQGFARWGVESPKICEVSWSDMHQGLVAHIDRYRNSPVMHESVPDQYKPATFAFGVRVAFPPPTKKLRGPRIRRPVDAGGEDDDGVGADDAADDAAADGTLLVQ